MVHSSQGENTNYELKPKDAIKRFSQKKLGKLPPLSHEEPHKEFKKEWELELQIKIGRQNQLQSPPKPPRAASSKRLKSSLLKKHICA